MQGQVFDEKLKREIDERVKEITNGNQGSEDTENFLNRDILLEETEAAI